MKVELLILKSYTFNLFWVIEKSHADIWCFFYFGGKQYFKISLVPKKDLTDFFFSVKKDLGDIVCFVDRSTLCYV